MWFLRGCNVVYKCRNCWLSFLQRSLSETHQKKNCVSVVDLNLPSTCWVFVVERLVDDAHDGLACAAEVNPDQNQRTVQTRGRQLTLLQHLLSALDVLAGSIWRTEPRDGQTLVFSSLQLESAARKKPSLSPMGSIQMPSSEGLSGTDRPSVWASIVAGSWWMARASRAAAVRSPSSTAANRAAVSSSVPHTVTVTLSPGRHTDSLSFHLITLITAHRTIFTQRIFVQWHSAVFALSSDYSGWKTTRHAQVQARIIGSSLYLAAAFMKVDWLLHSTY